MRTHVIYHDCAHIELLEKQLQAKSRFGGMADTAARRDFLLALQAAVSKNDIIIVVGHLSVRADWPTPSPRRPAT